MGLPAAGSEQSSPPAALPAAGFPGAAGRDPSWLKPRSKAGALLSPPLLALISDEIQPADRSAALPPAQGRVAQASLPTTRFPGRTERQARVARLALPIYPLPGSSSPAGKGCLASRLLPSASLAAAVAAAASCWQLPARMR